MVKSFQSSSHYSFSLIDPYLEYWYIIWKVDTANRELNLKNTFCTLCQWGWGFHTKPVFIFSIFLLITCSLTYWLKGSFRLLNYDSDSRRNGLRGYNENRKDLGSNPSWSLIGFWEPTLLPGSRWYCSQVSIKRSN